MDALVPEVYSSEGVTTPEQTWPTAPSVEHEFLTLLLMTWSSELK